MVYCYRCLIAPPSSPFLSWLPLSPFSPSFFRRGFVIYITYLICSLLLIVFFLVIPFFFDFSLFSFDYFVLFYWKYKYIRYLYSPHFCSSSLISHFIICIDHRSSIIDHRSSNTKIEHRKTIIDHWCFYSDFFFFSIHSIM